MAITTKIDFEDYKYKDSMNAVADNFNIPLDRLKKEIDLIYDYLKYEIFFEMDEWNSLKVYEAYELVLYNNILWKSTDTNSNSTPSDLNNWEQYKKKQEIEWRDNYSYVAGDLVQHTNKQLYSSLLDNNVNIPFSNTSYWQPWAKQIADSFDFENVDNTSDTNKPISDDTQEALDLKAPIESPTFTGTVSGITKAMVGIENVDNTSDLDKPISDDTQETLDLKANILDTYTQTQINQKFNDLVDTAPEALDTLKELSVALGNDENFASTVTTSIALKANILDTYTQTQADDKFSTIITYLNKNSSYLAQANNHIFADTTNEGFTITLPSTPSIGNKVIIQDSMSNFDINNLTVARNNETIMNISDDMLLSTKNEKIEFVYTGTDWRIS